jgi:hypothetical protein
MAVLISQVLFLSTTFHVSFTTCIFSIFFFSTWCSIPNAGVGFRRTRDASMISTSSSSLSYTSGLFGAMIGRLKSGCGNAISVYNTCNAHLWSMMPSQCCQFFFANMLFTSASNRDPRSIMNCQNIMHAANPHSQFSF